MRRTCFARITTLCLCGLLLLTSCMPGSGVRSSTTLTPGAEGRGGAYAAAPEGGADELAAHAPAAGAETEAGRAGALERALAEKARSYGQRLAASQDAASLAPMAADELRGYFESLAGERLRAALKEALPEYQGGQSQSADAFMSALTPRIEASVTEIVMAAVSNMRGGSEGQAGGAALSASLEKAQGDLLAALIESGAAAAQASGLPFTGNLEIEGTVSSDGKPEYRILTTQELWASADIRHTALAQASFSSRDDRETYNLGAAYRYLSEDEKHLFGVNAFFDYQMPYQHRRMSVGADYHNSLLDAHLNRYIALSGWQDARFGYEEQPLSGWDAELGGRPPFAQWLRVSARGFIWEQDVTPVLNADGDDVTGQEYAFEITPMKALTWRAQITDESGRDPYLESTLRFQYRMGERAREQLRASNDWSLESVADLRLTKVRRENRIIVQERQEPDFTAIVANTVGANTALTQDGQSKALTEGMAIAFGTALRIANTAGAIGVLSFGNGAVLRLAQDSRAEIGPGQIAITQGTAQFISGGSTLNLVAGGNDIALLGTDVDVRIAGGATTLRVRDGAANFRDGNGVTRLAAGEIARAVDGDAVPPQKLAEADPAFSAHESETHERLNLAGEALALPKAAPYVPEAVQVGGTYAAASQITFAVTFTKPVSVSGAPELAFTLGGAARAAGLSGGSGTKTLTFGYTVTGADPGSPDIVIEKINLNGGSITGTSGQLAVITVLGSIGGATDSARGEITSVTAPVAATYADGQTLDFVIKFNEAVNVDTSGGAPSLELDIDGVARQAVYQSGSGSTSLTFHYATQAGDLDLNGIAMAAINLNGGSIRDKAGNKIDLGSFTPSELADVRVDAPGLKIDFVNHDTLNDALETGSLDLSAAFSRASMATYYDENGVLRTSVIDEPRFDHDPQTGQPRGLLLEAERTNTAKNFSPRGGFVLLTPGANDPAGGNDAFEAQVITDSGGVRSISFANTTSVAGRTDVVSVFAKAGSWPFVLLRMGSGNAHDAFMRVDLGTGTITGTGGATFASAGLTPLPNGWYRLHLISTATGDDPGSRTEAISLDSNGGAPGPGETIYIFGPQYEPGGSFVTSYFPNGGSTATREADGFIINDLNWFEETQGTFAAEIETQISEAGNNRIISTNGSESPISIQNSHFPRGVNTWNGSQILVVGPVGAADLTTGVTSGVAWDAGGRSLSLAGALSVDNNAMFGSSPTRVGIGMQTPNNGNINGHFKVLKYYPRRVSDTQLQLLTAP